jgi:hypothetical protein
MAVTDASAKAGAAPTPNIPTQVVAMTTINDFFMSLSPNDWI